MSLDRSRPSPFAERVAAWVIGHREEFVEVLSELVTIPSENRAPHGSELEFQCRYSDLLSAAGLKVHEYLPTDVAGLTEHELYWPGRCYEGRPNVMGVLGGQGIGRSLLLSGHGDVVIGLNGEREPFSPTVAGDRLYGRGSADMKGGLVAALFAVRCLRDLGVALAGDVSIESVVDEEMGGANGTLAARLAGVRADAAIVLEPNELVVSPAHLGGRVYRITVHGKGGMGFAGEDVVNPVYPMAVLIQAIGQFAHERAAIPAPQPHLDPGRGLETIVSIATAADFPPGMGDGVPRQALLEVWVEAWPGTTAEQLDEAFLGYCRGVVAESTTFDACTVDFEHVTRFLTGSSISDAEPVVACVAEAFRPVRGGQAGPIRCAPFACDMFILHDFGVPAVILGPRGGNAHGADEWVSLASLDELIGILVHAAVAWCGTVEEQPVGPR